MSVTNVNLRSGWEREQKGDLAAAQASYQAWTASGADTGEGWFRLGVVCLKQGLFSQAEAALTHAVSLQWKPAEASNLLGVAQAGRGQPQAAEQSFRAAVARLPQFVEAHVNLGRALLEQGRLPEAQATLEHAVRIDRSHVSAWENLASLYLRSGQDQSAMRALRAALELQPHNVNAILALCELLARHGELDEARRGFELAQRLAPQRADVQVGLGVVLTLQQQVPAAREHFARAAALDPQSSAAWSNLGNAHRELGDLSEAESCLQRAVALNPRDVCALANLGTLCLDRRELESAREHFQRALAVDPQSPDARVGLASLHTFAGEFSIAQEILQQVVAQHPQMVQAQINLAALELLLGHWESGLERYEWRWRLPTASPPRFRQPAWDGRPQPGKTLLLHCEQGMGDTLQYCRFAQLAKPLVGQVLLAAPTALHQLLSRTPGIDDLLPPEPLPTDFDMHLSLMSLARVLKVTPATIPTPIPYIHPDPQRVAEWQARLPDSDEFRIGLVWRGNPKYRGDRERSVELSRFANIARLPAVKLYALQKEAVADEIAQVAGQFSVVNLAAELDTGSDAFVDTAAVMQRLDLVISVDSAPAHLAGALGVPVWLMLSHVAHWPWLTERDDNLWYPNTRLFRQPGAGDWQSVFRRMAEQLAQLLEKRS